MAGNPEGTPDYEREIGFSSPIAFFAEGCRERFPDATFKMVRLCRPVALVEI
jgi:hypothetical protein